VSGPKLLADERAEAPRRPCEFTPKQRHDIYRLFLKLHETIQRTPCTEHREARTFCQLHKAAIGAMGPLVASLANGDGDLVMKMMALHRTGHPDIQTPALMKAVAASLVEGTGTNGKHG
jgi:hypothetical protein